MACLMNKKNEKGKFKSEWELINKEKKKLRQEAKCLAKKREVIYRLLKNKSDSPKLEKKAI
jgi:hypothetical protein